MAWPHRPERRSSAEPCKPSSECDDKADRRRMPHQLETTVWMNVVGPNVGLPISRSHCRSPGPLR
jgi:hypothetical protein